MNDFNAVFNAGIHLVPSHNVFWVVVPDLHEVSDLTVRIHRELNADLHINLFIPAGGHKVDLFGCVFADENLISPAFQLQKDDVFQGTVQHGAVVAQQGVLRTQK